MQVQDRKFTLPISRILGTGDQNPFSGTKFANADLSVEVNAGTGGGFTLTYEITPAETSGESFPGQPKQYDGIPSLLDRAYQAIIPLITTRVYEELKGFDPRPSEVEAKERSLYTRTERHISAATEGQITQAVQNTMLGMAANPVGQEITTPTEITNLQLAALKRQITGALAEAGCAPLSDEQLNAVAAFAHQHAQSQYK